MEGESNSMSEVPELQPCRTCNGRGWYLERLTDNQGTSCETCSGSGQAVVETAPPEHVWVGQTDADRRWWQEVVFQGATRYVLADIAESKVDWLLDHAHCEQCDVLMVQTDGKGFNAIDVPFCGQCWNSMAKRMLAAESEVARLTQSLAESKGEALLLAQRDALADALRAAVSDEFGWRNKARVAFDTLAATTPHDPVEAKNDPVKAQGSASGPAIESPRPALESCAHPTVLLYVTHGRFAPAQRYWSCQKCGASFRPQPLDATGKPSRSGLLKTSELNDSGEGPTGCLDDGDALSVALRQISPQRLNEILRETLGVEHGAMFCHHANEVPAKCPCDEGCYCKTHTCKNRPLHLYPTPLNQMMQGKVNHGRLFGGQGEAEASY